MSQSNIYLQLVTLTGPVIGEGLLEGFQGSVELKDFSWGMHVLKDPKAKNGGLGEGLRSMVGAGKTVTVKMEPLEFKKRFDIASSQIHTCLDNHIKVVSASITVLHIKHGDNAVSGAIHQPGFTLVATDGYFTETKVDLVPDGNSAEVVETVRMSFKRIVITYLKNVYIKGAGQNSVATAPFTHSS